MNKTSFAKRIFADVINGILDYLNGPQSNDKCYYERKAETKLRHTGEGIMITEAEVGVMWPQAKET